uniref:uncharacterized protein LOC101308410 n=1 Tax=Fragaria vesca subsp. vesca TaxID=101020 RepID=UPI0005C8ADA2|nr:PREDICTED: uncharacterized protein LOC101308410 [Fragaria vesca subsp. vesca]
MAFNFGSTTVSIAESLALCNGLIDAKRIGFKKVEVEGDSKLAIDVINGIFAPLEIFTIFFFASCLGFNSQIGFVCQGTLVLFPSATWIHRSNSQIGLRRAGNGLSTSLGSISQKEMNSLQLMALKRRHDSKMMYGDGKISRTRRESPTFHLVCSNGGNMFCT